MADKDTKHEKDVAANDLGRDHDENYEVGVPPVERSEPRTDVNEVLLADDGVRTNEVRVDDDNGDWRAHQKH